MIRVCVLAFLTAAVLGAWLWCIRAPGPTWAVAGVFLGAEVALVVLWPILTGWKS